MVAAGNDVHACRKDFTCDLGCDAGAAGGILAVGDDEIERVLLAQFWKQDFDGLAPGLSHDVTDEENFHVEI